MAKSEILKKKSKHPNTKWSLLRRPECWHFFRIKDIPASAFQDLHSLEWIKLYNNLLTTLHYELMEPVLDTLQHIDIHSEFSCHILVGVRYTRHALLCNITYLAESQSHQSIRVCIPICCLYLGANLIRSSIGTFSYNGKRTQKWKLFR